VLEKTISSSWQDSEGKKTGIKKFEILSVMAQGE
jgi:hypothetical protein